jgi:hypothetical protein
VFVVGLQPGAGAVETHRQNARRHALRAWYAEADLLTGFRSWCLPGRLAWVGRCGLRVPPTASAARRSVLRLRDGRAEHVLARKPFGQPVQHLLQPCVRVRAPHVAADDACLGSRLCPAGGHRQPDMALLDATTEAGMEDTVRACIARRGPPPVREARGEGRKRESAAFQRLTSLLGGHPRA